MMDFTSDREERMTGMTHLNNHEAGQVNDHSIFHFYSVGLIVLHLTRKNPYSFLLYFLISYFSQSLLMTNTGIPITLSYPPNAPFLIR